MVDLIHADSKLNEIGIIADFNCYDSVVALSDESGDSDWVLEIPTEIWTKSPINCKDYVYIEDSEWGGPVCRVKHTTSDGIVRIYGINWRGILAQKVIKPKSGQTHYLFVLTEANRLLRQLADGWMEDLIEFSAENSGITLSGAIRYKPLLSCAESLLSKKSGRLSVCFSDGRVYVSVLPVRDLTGDIELSGEYESELTTIISHGQYNHILALGQGEMLERTVAELWVLPNGSITDDGAAPGVPGESSLRTLLYDYPAAESLEVLIQNAEKKLRSAAAGDSIEIDLSVEDAEVQLTDFVTVRDTLSGLTARLQVVSKNLRITEAGERITVKLR